jgi:hypothetical protein
MVPGPSAMMTAGMGGPVVPSTLTWVRTRPSRSWPHTNIRTSRPGPSQCAARVGREQERPGRGHPAGRGLSGADRGELAQARESWQHALAILEDLQHHDADQVRAKLASTNDHAS